MRRAILAVAVVAAIGGVAVSQQPPGAELGGKGKAGGANGRRWGYEVLQNKKTVLEGILRCKDFKVYAGSGGKEIGSYRQIGAGKYELDITEGKLEGKHRLVLTVNPPNPVYSGDIELKGGGKAYFRMKHVD
jgi:hypothetical protein